MRPGRGTQALQSDWDRQLLLVETKLLNHCAPRCPDKDQQQDQCVSIAVAPVENNFEGS